MIDQGNSRAILYGESLFVTLLATPSDDLLFVQEQWKKLTFEMQFLDPTWNEAKEKAHFAGLVTEQLQLQSYHQTHKRVRLNIQLSAKTWPLLMNKELTEGHWFNSVYVHPVEFHFDQLPSKKVKIFTKSTDERMQFMCKVGSFGHESLHFLKQQNNKDWNDYLWVNPDQTIRECATANVFALLKTGEWITPSSRNCYNGVTRQHFMQWLRQQSYKVLEEDISVRDLSKVECLFFTNSVQFLGEIEIPECNFSQSKNSYDKEKFIQLRKQFYLDMLTTTSGKLSI